MYLTLNLKPRKASSKVDLPSDCTGKMLAVADHFFLRLNRSFDSPLLQSAGDLCAPGLRWQRSLGWPNSLQRPQQKLASGCTDKRPLEDETKIACNRKIARGEVYLYASKRRRAS